MRFSVNRHVLQPDLSRVIRALHDIKNTEAIKHRTIGLVAGIESHDGGVAAQCGGDSAPTASAIGIVVERERVAGCAAGNRCLSAERPAARPPQTSAILEIRVKISSPAVDSQGNGVGRAPLVDRIRVEETDQGMATTLRHIQDARNGKRIAERGRRNDLSVKGRLARRCDVAANFTSRSAGIATGTTEAKVLDDLSGGRIRRTVVAAIPAWIRVECFGLQQQ